MVAKNANGHPTLEAPILHDIKSVHFPSRRSPYRPDIDGLRGIAIVLVVGFHAFPDVFRGGFVGVDVFFVVSGFLITGLILEGLSTRRFSFLEFYGRRARRIFPALIVVLLAVCALGWKALLADEFEQLGKHVLAGAAFVSNIKLWSEVGYFDTAANTKPLLHLWSLGVEEQFYLLWPLLLWLAWRVRANIQALCIVVAAASFGSSIYLLPHHPAAAFYSPFSRFWELMLGAWLAASARQSRAGWGSASLRQAAAIAGLSLIAATVWLIGSNTPFPGWWAALPVAGTGLVIIGGTGDTWLNRVVLAWPALRFIGLISYPLYLWHWPLLSLSRIVESEVASAPIRLAASGVACVLAAATYWFVERPCRSHPVTAGLSAALVTALVACGVSGYMIERNAGYPFRIDDNARLKLELQEQLFVGTPCDVHLPHFDDAHCASVGNTKRTALIVGDSHVRHSFFVLKDHLLAQGLSVIALSKGGCPFLLGVTTANVADCEATNREVLDFIARRQDIQYIFLAAEYTSYVGSNLRPAAGVTVEPGREPLLGQALASTLERLGDKHVVFMYQVPPLTFDPRRCVPRPIRLTRSTSACDEPRADVDREVTPYRAVVDQALKRFPAVVSFDMTDALCDHQKCYASNYGDVLYYNQTHLNAIGVEFVKRRVVFPKLVTRAVAT
jgi:peptidoglycan/LPS O-acetylase OafA/YrhL